MNDLSVIIPTLNAASSLAGTIAALGPVREVIVSDAGSVDGTVEIAMRCGARVVAATRGRGPQLIAGADAAQGPWFLFLHADTLLQPEWRLEAGTFMSRAAQDAAAVFRFVLSDASGWARWLERVVAARTRILCLPYGDQGLLIHKDLYRRVGGFRAMPLMEDVDIVRRLGCGRLHRFTTGAVTSAVKWKRDGWMARSLRNLFCLSLYFFGVPPRILVRLYG